MTEPTGSPGAAESAESAGPSESTGQTAADPDDRSDSRGGSQSNRQSRRTASATAFYDRWARLYEPIAAHAPGVGRLRRRAVDALRLERGDTVVEIGCGTGANLPLLARDVGPTGTVIGIDRSRGVLERARRNTRGYPQVEVLQADATQLPIDTGPAALENDATDTLVGETEGVQGDTDGMENEIDGAQSEIDGMQADIDGILATFVVGMLDDPAAAVDDWIDHLELDGHVALLHLRRSEHAIAPISNPALELFTVLSTPPTTKLRYDRELSRMLDRRVRAAGDTVRQRTEPSITESHLFDLVELTAGRRP